jgi:tetratricopeptide (TPR) repeat protein
MVDEVAERLLGQGLVIVHGMSGCGKSSLVRAGVLPRLVQDAAGHSAPPWHVAVMRPGEAPLNHLAAAIMTAVTANGPSDPILNLQIRRLLNLGRGSVSELCSFLGNRSTGPVCVLIDQFEEIFRYAASNRDEVELFVAVLSGAIRSDPSGSCLHLVVTVRSDFLGDCAQYPSFAETVNRVQYLLPRMPEAALARAIREPALLFGGDIEPELLHILLAEARGEADDLPLIQHSLMWLWQRSALADDPHSEHTKEEAAGHLLRAKDYRDAGGAKTILSEHADETLLRAGLSVADARTEHLFRALIDVDHGGRVIRRPQRLRDLVDLVGGAHPAVAVKSLVNAFRAEGDSFLLPGPEDLLEDSSIVDIRHEALIRHWRRIAAKELDQDGRPVGWLERERYDGELWKALRVQAQALERDPEALLSDETTRWHKEWLARIPAPQVWSKRYYGAFTEVDKLIRDSEARLDRRLQSKALFREGDLTSLGELLERANNAEKQAMRNRSTTVGLLSRELAQAGDPGTALLLALEVLVPSSAGPGAQTFPPVSQPVPSGTLGVHSDRDTDRILAESRDELTRDYFVYVPEAEQAAYTALQGFCGRLGDQSASTDVAAQYQISPLKVWAIEPFGPTLVTDDHSSAVVSLEFGAGGELLRSYSSPPGGSEQTTRGALWRSDVGAVGSLWESSGQFIEGSYAATGQPWILLPNHELVRQHYSSWSTGAKLPTWLEEPLSVAIAPSGRLAAAVDWAGRYAILSLADFSDPRLLTTNPEVVAPIGRWRASFSQDGQRLMMLSDQLEGVGFEIDAGDQPSRVLEIARTATVLGRIIALDPSRWRWVRDVSVTGESRLAVGGGAETTIGISLPSSGGAIIAAQFSRDGRRLLVAMQRGPIRLYDLTEPNEPIAIFGGEADRFIALAYARAGDMIAGVRQDCGALVSQIFESTEALIEHARAFIFGTSGVAVALASGQRNYFGLSRPSLPPEDAPLSVEELSTAIRRSTEIESAKIAAGAEHALYRAHALVVMPFGRKMAADGTEIDFDLVYRRLIRPAVAAAGLMPRRADADRRGGPIHPDILQELLLADYVVADLTFSSSNVCYEMGVRHALRARGVVLICSLDGELSFDIAGQHVFRYHRGSLDAELIKSERKALKETIEATLGARRGQGVSPVYQQLPNLTEPDWKTLKVGDVNEFWKNLEAWQGRVEVARRKQRPGDVLVLADEAPNRAIEFEALRTAARALIRLLQPRYALSIIERARRLDPDDVEARQLQGIALGRAGRYAEARESLRRLADERKDGESLGLLARTWKDEWRQIWDAHPQRKLDPVAAARETASILQSAASAYIEAFRAAPGDYYPGVNALTLGRLWEHVTGRRSRLRLDLIAAGVGWTAAAAAERNKDYWSIATRAELALIENRKDDAIDDYAEAAALAVANRDWFALDSSSRRRRSQCRDRSSRAASQGALR